MPNPPYPKLLDSSKGWGPFTNDLLKVAEFLLNARQLAEREMRPLWDFALEITDLLRLGLTHHHLRWLSAERLADFGEEMGRSDKNPRKFRILAPPVVCFPERTACILTTSGHFLFSGLQIASNEMASAMHVTGPGHHVQSTSTDIPQWEGNKKLYFRGTLVREFKQPAPHEKAILSAFQAAEWHVAFIVNPLLMVDPADRGEKATNAVKKLNGHQDPQLLTFCIVDKGHSIGWRPKH